VKVTNPDTYCSTAYSDKANFENSVHPHYIQTRGDVTWDDKKMRAQNANRRLRAQNASLASHNGIVIV
jgi:hypothetical protein